MALFGKKKKFKKVEAKEMDEEEIEEEPLEEAEELDDLEGEEPEEIESPEEDDEVALQKKLKAIQKKKASQKAQMFVKLRAAPVEDMFNSLSDRMDSLELAVKQVVEYLKARE